MYVAVCESSPVPAWTKIISGHYSHMKLLLTVFSTVKEEEWNSEET